MLFSCTTILLTFYAVAVALPQTSDDELDAQYAQLHEQENFDPNRATDPTHNISCVGSTFDLHLPLQTGWNPNNRTVQQICAKPQYYGGPPGQHVGGWCNHNQVMFDKSPEAQISNELATPRVLLGCRYRCFCNLNIPVENRNVQPKPSESQNSLQVQKNARESYMTDEIRLDVQELGPVAGTLGETDVDVVQVSYLKEIRGPESLENPHREYVSEDEGNKITCGGPLPTFRLPPPYNNSGDFRNNQQLCAVQLNGGLLGANAGGYCHRSDAVAANQESISQTIFFSDEMTPRLDWTWAGGYFFASASIRFHCYRNCRCSTGETERNATSNLWTFVAGHPLSLTDSGQIDLLGPMTPPRPSSGRPPAKRMRMTVLPKQNGNASGTSPSGTCGWDGQQFCPQAWPTALLGPVPSAPPNTTEVVKPGPEVPVAKGAKPDLTVCGNQCSGPQDCASGNGTDHACACAFPNQGDARLLGLDPVMPVSVCLVLMTVAFGKGKGGDLIGRDAHAAVGPYVDGEQGEEWRCRCNATFTHNRCCGSRDGMIWL